MQDAVEVGGSSEENKGPRTREEVQAIAVMTSPWVEKYRPESLSDVIAHHDIVATCESEPEFVCLFFLLADGVRDAVNRFVDQNKLPHLLLYGPPGTGKTSTILALAKRIFGPKYKVRLDTTPLWQLAQCC